MLMKMLAGLTVSVGLLLAVSSAYEANPSLQSQGTKERGCCEGKGMNCCEAGKKSACCEAEGQAPRSGKLGSCEKGQKCCAENRECCRAVQTCCEAGEACCDRSKACCGQLPKRAGVMCLLLCRTARTSTLQIAPTVWQGVSNRAVRDIPAHSSAEFGPGSAHRSS
jgi:hypothetical protein